MYLVALQYSGEKLFTFLIPVTGVTDSVVILLVCKVSALTTDEPVKQKIQIPVGRMEKDIDA